MDTIPPLERRLNLLRRRVGRLQADSLAAACVDRLREVEHAGIDVWRTWRPWHLLDLLYMGLLYGRRTPARLVDQDALATLMNLVRDTDALVLPDKNPGAKHAVSRFMRQIAFEQFWLQHDLTSLDFGRLELIYGGMSPKNELRQLFESRAGIRVEEYIDCLFLLLTWSNVNRGNAAFKSDNIFHLSDIPRETSSNFLSLLSTPIDGMQAWLKNSKRIKNTAFELLEPVPFIRKPIIQVGDVYYLTSHRVLMEHVRVGFVQLCHDMESNITGRAAGKLQESHLESLLSAICPDLKTESNFKRHLARGDKIADFVVPSSDACVIVESKAIDPHARWRTEPSAEIIDMYLSELVDGFRQCLDTAAMLRAHGERRRIICWVITRSEFYVSSGRAVWSEVIEGRLASDLVAEVDFHISSLSDAERVLGTCRSGDELAHFLTSVGRLNEVPMEGRYLMGMHLPPGSVPQLPGVRQAYERVVNRISDRLTKARG